jgi:2-oxoglutarate dehydrogenase complex dehydrogenase (E1) component-like enzyme
MLYVCRVKRVILCSGKHFYALDAYRREKGLRNTALIRLEVTKSKRTLAKYYVLK